MTQLVPFGKKYRDQDVKVLLNDREYCLWLVKAGWLESTYPDIFNAIVKRYGLIVIHPEKSDNQKEIEALASKLIKVSVREYMLNKVNSAALAFESRFTLNALQREAPDLHEAIEDQQSMFYDKLTTAFDEE